MGLSENEEILLAGKAYFVGADFFSRFEPYCFARRDCNFFTRPGIPPHAALSGLDDEDSKSSQLDSFTTLQRILERIEDRFHRNFRFDLRDIQLLSNTVYDVLLYHAEPPIS
jgi:hypothetical protein